MLNKKRTVSRPLIYSVFVVLFCTSGKPATLVATDSMAASAVADMTMTQLTSCSTAADPTVATKVCAAVLTALIPAAFAHCAQYSLFFMYLCPSLYADRLIRSNDYIIL